MSRTFASHLLPARRVRATLEGLARGRVTSRLLRGVFKRRIPPAILNSPLLFIHVPKNAGTSIKQALYPAADSHRSLCCYDFLDPAFVRRTTIFAVVRDPRDRFLSAYDFFKAGGAHATFSANSRNAMEDVATLDDLLDHIESVGNDWLKLDDVFRPQYWYLVDRTGRIAVDDLFPYSNDIADVSDYLRAHGFPAPMHLNRTARTDTRLTAEQARRVDAIYARDVTLFADVTARAAAKVGIVAEPVRNDALLS